MKCKVNYKESEWPQFNAEVQKVVKQQQEEITRALSGRGQFRILPSFSISATAWTKMKPEQRREVINKFNKATMKSGLTTMPSSSGEASTSHIRVSVTPQDGGITNIARYME